MQKSKLILLTAIMLLMVAAFSISASEAKAKSLFSAILQFVQGNPEEEAQIAPASQSPCFTEKMGDETSCKSPETWKEYADKFCQEKGARLNSLNTFEQCSGDGSRDSKYVKFECCAGPIPTTPVPSPVPAQNEISKPAERPIQSKEIQKPMQPQNFEQDNDYDPDWISAQEIQQALRELKDIKKEINRVIKQAKKSQSTAGLAGELSVLLEQAINFEKTIQSDGTRESVEDFRDAQLWEEFNIMRAKIEIPKEITRWTKEIKKAERLLSGLKNIKSFSINMEQLKSKLEETKTALAEVQKFYNSNDLEEAMSEFDLLREDFHPGEITSVIQRLKEADKAIRKIKNEDAKNQAKAIVQEVLNELSEGEYRIARETMDKRFGELMRLVENGKKK